MDSDAEWVINDDDLPPPSCLALLEEFAIRVADELKVKIEIDIRELEDGEAEQVGMMVDVAVQKRILKSAIEVAERIEDTESVERYQRALLAFDK